MSLNIISVDYYRSGESQFQMNDADGNRWRCKRGANDERNVRRTNSDRDCEERQGACEKRRQTFLERRENLF